MVFSRSIIDIYRFNIRKRLQPPIVECSRYMRLNPHLLCMPALRSFICASINLPHIQGRLQHAEIFFQRVASPFQGFKQTGTDVELLYRVFSSLPGPRLYLSEIWLVKWSCPWCGGPGDFSCTDTLNKWADKTTLAANEVRLFSLKPLPRARCWKI